MAEPESDLNLYHTESDGASKSASPSELVSQETNAPNYSPSSSVDNFNFSGNDGREPARSAKLIKALGKLKSKKGLLVTGGIGGGLLAPIIILILILFFAGLFKVPALSTLIVQQEFARMERQFASNADRVVEEKLALEDTSHGVFTQIQQEDQNLKDNMWSKLNDLRPSNIIQNFEGSSNFKINSHYSPWGNRVLDSVEISGEKINIQPVSKLARYTPIFSQISEFKNNLSVARDLAPALENAMDAQDIGPVMRYLIAADIRQKLGIGLIAWSLAKIAGPTQNGVVKPPSPAQVEEDLNQETGIDVMDTGGPPQVSPEKVQPLANGEQSGSQIAQQDLQSLPTVGKIVAANGVDTGVTSAVKTAVQAISGVISTVTSIINPAYALALPACIVYEGSLDQSGPVINNQTQAQEKSFYFLADAADEQKAGAAGQTDPTGSVESEAVGAMSNKLGDISQSNPYIAANGGTLDTSTSSLSAEASPLGGYTLLNTTFPGPTANIIGAIANQTCPILTNLGFAVGTGLAFLIAQVAGDVVSDGGTSVGVGSLEATVDGVTTTATKSIMQRILDSLATRTGVTGVGTSLKGATTVFSKAQVLLGSTLKTLRAAVGNAKSTGISIGLTVGLTVAAKFIVMDRVGSGGFYTGLEQGPDYVNEAASGANIQAGELERQQLFGRALTCAEIMQSNQADQQFIAARNQTQSLTNRYLAISNPDSLLSHVAMAINTDTNGSLSTPFSSFLSNALFGSVSFSSLFANLLGVVHAQSSCGSVDYGNVQFGWSQAEESLIKDTASYAPLENRYILDQSGQEDAIAQDYAYCFGYDYNPKGDGSLDPTDPNGNLVSDITGTGPYLQSGKNGSIGDLLANGDIVRDSNGDVVANQGNCSPQNLSINNQYFGDLVFRWRLAMSYNTTLDQLTSEQSVVSSGG